MQVRLLTHIASLVKLFFISGHGEANGVGGDGSHSNSLNSKSFKRKRSESQMEIDPVQVRPSKK